MDTLLLGIVLLGSLFLIPFGLPGTWLMVASAVGFNVLTGSDRIGFWSLLIVAAMAVAGEVLEFSLSSRYTKKYGGSRRAGWGAIIGGMVGAFVGVPLPIVGSMIGAFVGAFAGALIAEYSRQANASNATRVATGALIGRVVAAAMKVAIGLLMAVWILFAAWS
jgi:uncharacterized protein YqgC (DUF456 family)